MKQTLTKILSHVESKAKFYNTLSFLEYIGARKIMKSQRQAGYTIELLNHAAEEIRHAQLLKRAALKLSQVLVSGYQFSELFCGEQANHYFQSIDHACGELLTNTYFSYLCTTYVLEKRVVRFYNDINDTLILMQSHSPFRSILADENRHLDFMENKINESTELTEILNHLLKIEMSQFVLFSEALAREINTNFFYVDNCDIM